ncbi:hypothetical protein QOT17_000465 [Balamuthia mandrillaris]
MGNDSSKAGGGRTKRGAQGQTQKTRVQVLDEASVDSIPYTSYSVERKPETAGKGKQGEAATTSPQEEGKSTNEQPVDEIITIKQQETYTENLEPELQWLETLPKFGPLIQPTGPFSSEKTVSSLDSKALLMMCSDYQRFCRETGIVLANEQRALGEIVKAKEQQTMEALQRLIQHQRDIKVLETQMKEVYTVKKQLETTKTLLEGVIAKADQLSSILPEEERMPPLSSLLSFPCTEQQPTTESVSTTQSST